MLILNTGYEINLSIKITALLYWRKWSVAVQYKNLKI